MPPLTLSVKASDRSVWSPTSPYGPRPLLMAQDLSLWPKTSPYAADVPLFETMQQSSHYDPSSQFRSKQYRDPVITTLQASLCSVWSKQCRNPIITTPQASLGRNNTGIQSLRPFKPVYVPFGRNNAGIQPLRHFRPVDAPGFSRNHAGI